MARLLCAFPVVLKQYLRGIDNIDGSVAHILDRADRGSLMRTRNKPLCVCNLLAQQISAVPERPEVGAGGLLPLLHTVTASITYGYSLYYLRLQPLLPTVTASIT